MPPFTHMAVVSEDSAAPDILGLSRICVEGAAGKNRWGRPLGGSWVTSGPVLEALGFTRSTPAASGLLSIWGW